VQRTLDATLKTLEAQLAELDRVNAGVKMHRRAGVKMHQG
jgi:hypothetical protein